MSSVTAWLGCVLVASTIYIEKYVDYMCKEIKEMNKAKSHRESKVFALTIEL